VDPLVDVLIIARRHDLWAHFDSAYGAFFGSTDEGPARLREIEECDSLALNSYKGMFRPYDTGCLLVRRRGALTGAHSTRADYLQDIMGVGDEIDFGEQSPEHSQDFHGLRLWLPVLVHRLARIREEVNARLALARHAYEALRHCPELALPAHPTLSVVTFQLRGNAAHLTGEQLRRVNRHSTVMLSSTVMDGICNLSLCILNFRTRVEHVDQAVQTILTEVRELLNERRVDPRLYGARCE
jgi:aromatic-L-amino-acid decarboxylase